MEPVRWPIDKPVTRSMTRRGGEAAEDSSEPEIQGAEGRLAVQPTPSDSTVTATSTVVASEVLTVSLREPISQRGQGLLSTTTSVGGVLSTSQAEVSLTPSVSAPLPSSNVSILPVSSRVAFCGSGSSVVLSQPPSQTSGRYRSSGAVSLGVGCHSDSSVNRGHRGVSDFHPSFLPSVGSMQYSNELTVPVSAPRPLSLRDGRAGAFGIVPPAEGIAGINKTMGSSGNEWLEPGRPGPGSVRSQMSYQHLEPKVTLPLFKGKSEWRVFWLQFEKLAFRFGWSAEETRDRLVSCLRDEAMEFYADLAPEVRTSLRLTVTSLSRRFDDQKLPETYRATLQTLHKQPKEGIEEYAARVQKMVGKAYPGIAGTSLMEDLTIEYLVGGLPDHSLVYDVMTKKPRTVEAALDLIQWHESCRGIQRKRAGVRQVSSETDGASISRVNGKAYVTEKRLHQFGRDLSTGIVKELRVELAKMGPGRTQRRARQGASWKETAECYNCHELGHLARECPNRVEEPRQSSGDSESETSVAPLN